MCTNDVEFNPNCLTRNLLAGFFFAEVKRGARCAEYIYIYQLMLDEREMRDERER